MMTIGEILQGFRNLRQKLHRMIGNGVGEPGDLRMEFGRHRFGTEPFERVGKRVLETMKAITMLHDTLALHVVENAAHLIGRESMMIEK